MFSFYEFLNENTKIFYWRPRQGATHSNHIRIGSPVPASRLAFDNYLKKLTEKFIEECRLKINPQAPSRLGAIFLSPTQKDCKQWGTNRWRDSCFAVNVSGNYFIADVEWFDLVFEIIEQATRQQYDYKKKRIDIYEYAKNYWTGEHSPDPHLEVIVDRNAKTSIFHRRKKMHFKLWLEAEVQTKDISNAIFNSISHLVGGRWLASYKQLMPPREMRSFDRLDMTGINVVDTGDAFKVFCQIYVYKRPDKSALPASKDDRSTWQKIDTYDSVKGSDLIDIYVAVYNKKNVKIASNYPHDITGKTHDYNPLKTPYEVAKFVQKGINDYNENGGGDNNDFSPEPITPKTGSPRVPILSY